MTRYTMLRETVAHLAAEPDAQARYLDDSFVDLTGGGSAADYGNNELVLEFDDIFVATEHMLEHGEITRTEIDSIRPLADMLEIFCKEADDSFWQREALYSDQRWNQLRRCATDILPQLPDEERDSDYLRGLQIADMPASFAQRLRNFFRA